MKIVFHLNSMGLGGAERVVGILSGCFAGMGHDVTIATEWRSAKEYETDPRVKRVHVGPFEDEYMCSFEGKSIIKRILTMIKRHTKLRHFVRESGPDVLISFCNKANFRASVALMGLSTRLIVSVRNDPDVDYAPYGFSTGMMKKKADGFVFQTEDAMKWFDLGKDAKATVIMNPLSDRICSIDKPLFDKNRWQDSTAQKTILSLGRIARQKNLMLLVKSFEKTLEDAPEIRLRVFGDTEDKDVLDDVRDYIKEKDLTEFIRISEATDDVVGELGKAYMFVLSSDYEGMPNSLMEAMAAGLPCISTDCPCGGPGTLIENGVSGILTRVSDIDDMSDAMRRIINDPSRAQELADNAYKIKEKLMPEKIASEWMSFILSVIENR